VILEATRLREHSELARAESFGDFSLEVLTSGAILEIWCSLDEICKEPKYMDLVRRFGVADASLLFISAREGCLLLTDDDRLFAAHGAGSKFELWGLDE
jgi:predicted nucleic acid-binding protein